jgi:hypothetical protein
MAIAPLTLTIIAGVTVIVDIPESRSPAGRSGRRVEEVRLPVVEGLRHSPAAEEIADGEFDVGLVGDCNDTVTSISDPGSGNDWVGAAGDLPALMTEGSRSEDVD